MKIDVYNDPGDHYTYAGCRSCSKVSSMTTVLIASPLRRCTKGLAAVTVSAVDIQHVLDSLMIEYPELRTQLIDGRGNLHRFVGVFVNGQDMHLLKGFSTAVAEHDTIEILLAVAGGFCATNSSLLGSESTMAFD